MFRGIRYLFRVVTTNAISLTGGSLATISSASIMALVALHTLGRIHSPYIGIVTFLVLPAFFVLGLLLIPIGVGYERWRRYKSGEREPDAAGPLPAFDLNKPRTRHLFQIVSLLTVFNIALIFLVSYEGYHYTESVAFCGTVCHTVMEPEYTAYQNSPHSRVACVDCHIGPGASWFVQSKLSGLRQVLAVARDSYSRPISTPVHNLRPSTDTCEQCHWPEKFAGDRLRVYQHYLDDEENTPNYTILLMKLGGGHGAGGGIHSWHIDKGKTTTYLASDDSREKIEIVRVTATEGTVTEYRSGNSALTEEEIAAGKWRTMDCVDCHNRPSHIYRPPTYGIDQAITDGRIDRGIPAIRGTVIETLNEAVKTFTPWPEVEATLRASYQENYPAVLTDQAEAFEASLNAVEAFYRTNVFPDMNVSWNTYPNHIGHTQSDGCYRCHDDSHEAEDGSVIRQDCDICHEVLAWEEEAPDILSQLGLE